MAGRGPAATPTAILKLRNSPDVSRRKEEPVPNPVIPPCPDWMPEDGRKEWDRITVLLAKFGCMTEWDASQMAAYCQAWAEFAEATKDTDGSWQHRDSVARRLMIAASKFGMSPADRVRVRAEKVKPKADGKARFFGSGGA